MSRTTAPTWMWPQGCSMRQRMTKSGARFCPALKKAALPEHRLVMLVAEAVVPPPAAHGGVALAEARDVAVGDAGVVVEDRVGVRGREIHLDIALDLAIGARCAGIEEEAGLLAREIPLGTARMGEASPRRGIREGV